METLTPSGVAGAHEAPSWAGRCWEFWEHLGDTGQAVCSDGVRDTRERLLLSGESGAGGWWSVVHSCGSWGSLLALLL